MKQFRYAFDVVLDEARAAEREVAVALASAEAAREDAVAAFRVVEALVRQIAAAASARDVVSEVRREGAFGLGVRERAGRVLAEARDRARGAIATAESACARTRAVHAERMQRRRSFELHRERALARHRLAVERVEEAELDEANGLAHEARSRALRMGSP